MWSGCRFLGEDAVDRSAASRGGARFSKPGLLARPWLSVKPADSLARRESVSQLTSGSLENGMGFVGGYLRQRLEREAALMHGRMGHLETRAMDDRDPE